MNGELENALAWFRAKPATWLEGIKDDLAAAAAWIWGVLEGDFNEDASTAQVVTGTVISMIPLVDQICDVRDIVANCKNIHKEPDQIWHWVGLTLTLIGLFPTLGSLVKGCAKVIFARVRKARYTNGVTPQIGKYIEQGIVHLNTLLARPEVAKTLTTLKIDNPYKYLATQFREIAAQLNVGKLLAAFDEGKAGLESLLNLVKKWGGGTLGRKAADLLELVNGVRRQADRMLAKALKPVQDVLDKIARRLDIEADMAYRAHLNRVNTSKFRRTTPDAEKRHLTRRFRNGWIERERKNTETSKCRPLFLKAPPHSTGGRLN